MSQWTAKFTKRQKNACIHARIVGGNSYGKVAKMAAAGELTDGSGRVPRFDITAHYVGKLCRAAAPKMTVQRLAQPEQAEHAKDEAQRRILALYLKELDKLETDARAGRLNIGRAKTLQRAIADHGAEQRSNGSAGTGREDLNTQDPNSAVQELIARANENGTQNEDRDEKPASLAGAG